jgi:hypothetical protein
MYIQNNNYGVVTPTQILAKVIQSICRYSIVIVQLGYKASQYMRRTGTVKHNQFLLF